MAAAERPAPPFTDDFDIDSLGNLVYWDPVSRRLQLLEPAQPIKDPYAVIGKVGQQNLLPGHFTLKPKDLELTVITDESGEILYDPVLPGASAFLFWGSGRTRQDRLSSLSDSCLGKPVTRKNRLYIAQVGDILGSGWTPYFAPLIGRAFPVYNPHHIILVPDSLRAHGRVMDATETEKASLASTFVRWDNYAV